MPRRQALFCCTEQYHRTELTRQETPVLPFSIVGSRMDCYLLWDEGLGLVAGGSL